MILWFVIVAMVMMAACASAVIDIMCEEERETIYGEVMDDAEQ